MGCGGGCCGKTEGGRVGTRWSLVRRVLRRDGNATSAQRLSRLSRVFSRSGVHELHVHTLRNEARIVAAIEEKAHGLPAALAVIEGPVIHVHSHEGVGSAPLQTPCVLHRVIESALSMLQAIRDAGPKMA